MTRIKNLALAAALTVSTAGIFAGTARADEFWDRFHNQQQRIEQGERNGSLTPEEARRLEQQEQQLERERHRLAENGLSSHDRELLNRDLNRESQRIYNQRHDEQVNERRHDWYADRRDRDHDHDRDDWGYWRYRH